jgi:type I restriction enzyme R subunit
MPTSGEHKTVQARILHYAQEIGWRYVPRAECEERRGFDSDSSTAQESARSASLYFGDLMHSKVLLFDRGKADLQLGVAAVRSRRCGLCDRT